MIHHHTRHHIEKDLVKVEWWDVHTQLGYECGVGA